MTDRRQRYYVGGPDVVSVQTPETIIVPKEQRVPVDRSNKALLAMILAGISIFCAIKDNKPKAIPPIMLLAGVAAFIGYQKTLGEIGADEYSEKLARWDPPHMAPK